MTAPIRLKFLADVQVSNVDKKSAEGERPVRLCNYTDVYYRDRITCNADFMDATAPPAQADKFRLRVGQILITKDSETAEDIGVPSYVDCEADDLVCGYHLAQITPVPGVEPRFLYWVLSADRTRSTLSVEASGVTRFGLRTETVENLRVSFPSLNQQRQIAAFLDVETERIDQLIATKRRMVVTIRQRFDALARKATTSGESVRLGRLLDGVQTGSTPSRGVSTDIDGLEWATPGDVAADLSVHPTNRRVTLEAAAELPTFPDASVLLVGIGATAGRIGFLDRVMTGNQQMTCLVPNSSRLDWRYLGWWMWSRHRELRYLAPYTTLPILNNDYVKSIEISIPSFRRQQEIASQLDASHESALETSGAIKRSIALLEERRRSLVTAAVTGDMDVS